MRAVRASLLLLTALLASLLAPASAPAAPAAQQQPICFPGVAGVPDCIDPSFAAYWRGNGGLPVFGYPLGPVGQVTPLGASAPLAAQWTERNRLEQHPANRAPYTIQIGRVGAERLAQLGRDPAAEGREAGPQPGCLWFAETGHNVCDQAQGLGFKSYWERNGLRITGLSRYQQSLALFGLPLTAANPEPGPNGELIVTQWFERARFEWHPENPAQFKVLLGLLGRELRDAAPAPSAQPAAATPAPVFGVEINRGVVGVAPRVAELGLQGGIVRYNFANWDAVEATRGRRDWSKLAAGEAELAAIAATGASPMAIVSGAPAWAQRERGKACGPIRPDALDEFASFMGELVTRYSKPPYNVRYWELGNEPDAPFQLIGGDSPFGCWGDSNDPFYGGEAYAAMLKAAYPAIKAADPNAVVLNGGLLLDCNPLSDQSCAAGRFFEGMLRAGAGDALDMVAFHSYVYWTPLRVDFDRTNPKWDERGMLTDKTAMLRELMRRYGVEKLLVMNEGALLCFRSDPGCGPGGFYDDQPNYVTRLYARSFALGLYGTVWYTLNGPGWQEGGLLDANQQPRPAFAAMRYMQQLLAGAGYAGGGVEGELERHRFTTPRGPVEILWLNAGEPREIPLPAGARALYTSLGERRPLGTSLQVSFEPVIVTFGAP
jgi:hypothetical protein